MSLTELMHSTVHLFQTQTSCDTIDMSYHETFWIAISASAPVIALASTVSAGDTLKLTESSGETRKGQREPGTWPVTLSAFITMGNMIFQVITLFIALLSIYNGKDETRSFFAAILSQPLGIALLVIVTFLNASVRLKDRKRRLSSAETSENTDDGTQGGLFRGSSRDLFVT